MTLATSDARDRRLVASRPQCEADWRWLAAILTAITASRLLALFLSPSELGFDEAQYWAWSRYLQFGYATKPPLIAWAIALETRVCGSGAPCVRALSPILHGATAFVLALVAARFYGRRTGVWTGIVYILVPGIALSSWLMTTDVFLLFFWSLALFALVSYLARPRRDAALMFGLAVAAGLYAKYAMIFLPFAVALAACALPEVRARLRIGDVLVAWLLILVLAAPNLWWNATNGFATFAHTGNENIGWSLARINGRRGFEFLGAQFGVAGPVVFGAMLAALLLGARTERPEADRLLLWLSWPILLAIAAQGFLAQANPNWGATAYPAGVILATALMLRHRRRGFLWANLAFGGAVSLALLLATAFWYPATASGPLRQFRQVAGWNDAGQRIAALAQMQGARRLVVDGRALTAGLSHAMRNGSLPILAFLPDGAAPTDQFEIDAPWRPASGARAGTLLLGLSEADAVRLGAVTVGAVAPPPYSRDDTLPVYGFPAASAGGS